MLSKDICKRCINRHRKMQFMGKERIFGWSNDELIQDEESWEKGIVRCEMMWDCDDDEYYDDEDYEPNILWGIWYYIDKEPTKDCKYRLEHLIS
jgi:hypothetical protein